MILFNNRSDSNNSSDSSDNSENNESSDISDSSDSSDGCDQTTWFTKKHFFINQFMIRNFFTEEEKISTVVKGLVKLTI